MELENRIKALVAVGASVTANCQACLQSTMQMALENGADEFEIAAVIEIGKKVRAGAASRMDHFISCLNVSARAGEKSGNGGCGCNPLVETMEAGKNE
jgi:AhpD family alkylhydroperoxidase